MSACREDGTPAKRPLEEPAVAQDRRPQPAAEPPSLSVLSSINEELPGVTFNLIADKKRTHVSPKEVANLCMWACMPIEHPLCCESPKWCYLRHKRHVKHCLVVHAEGLSFENATHHAWVAADFLASTAPKDPSAVERSNTWLKALRSLGPEVQFCPLWINSTSGKLDIDFFLRQDRSHKLRGGGGGAPAVSTTVANPSAADDATAATKGSPDAKPKKPSTALAWALQMAKKAREAGDGEGTLQERMIQAAAQNGGDAESTPQRDKGIPTEVQAAWDVPAEKLAEFCMSRQDLLEHGFTLEDDSFKPLLDLPPPTASPLPEGGAVPDVQPQFAVGVDCEMVMAANNRSMLARVSVVRVPTGDVLYDAIVKPTEPVVDYVTRYSGMTAEMLDEATVTFEEAQEHVRRLISRDTFVIGHGLENDFQALKLLPSDLPRVIDTTFLFPHTNGLPNKNALRYLAHGFLNGRKIQTGHDGHDSVEDATVCIELIGLKLKHGIHFGMPPRVNITQLLSTPMAANATAAEASTWEPPHLHLVDRHEVVRRVASRAVSVVLSKNDEDATRKASHILSKAASAASSSPAGTFVYLTLRELRNAAGSEEGTPDADAVAEVADSHASDLLNSRLARLVNAAPVGTLVVVMAAMCPTDTSLNRHSASHGSLWAFVKQRGHGTLDESPAAYTPSPLGTATTQCAQA